MCDDQSEISATTEINVIINDGNKLIKTNYCLFQIEATATAEAKAEAEAEHLFM